MKNYYQKRIEEKTGYNLGEIKIELLSDTARNLSYEWTIDEFEKLKNKNLNEKNQKREIQGINLFRSVLYSISKPIISIAYTGACAGSLNNPNKIIFNDSYFHRVLNETINDTNDFAMMHELSHFLFDKIAGEETKRGEKKKLEWAEGFCEYAADKYFREFILPGSLGSAGIGRTYSKGRKKIKKFLGENGENSFLEIPKKWKEFQNN